MAKQPVRTSSTKQEPVHETARRALATHAGSKNTIKFSEEIRVDRHRFFKGMVARFEDPAMAAYFDVAFNGTEFTKDEPNVTITKDELNFDPDAEGGTVDPHTVIGPGRKGIEPGTTVFGHVTGKGPVSDGKLQPYDSSAGSGAQ